MTFPRRLIAFFHRAGGTLVVDDGACRALCDQGRSLLSPGIARVDGEFQAGEVVRIADAAGRELARGLTRWSAADLRSGTGTGEVTVIVSRGDTLTEIGAKLQEAGVVLSAESFVNAASVDDRAGSIGPGRYTMRQQMNSIDALDLMLDPASRADSRLVLPEGLRLEQTVSIAAEATSLPKANFQKALQQPEELGLPAFAKESGVLLIPGEGAGDWTLRVAEADDRVSRWSGGRLELRVDQTPDAEEVPMPAPLARRLVDAWQRTFTALVPAEEVALPLLHPASSEPERSAATDRLLYARRRHLVSNAA